MDTEPRRSADHFGLAAFGRAGRWEVSILESLDRDDQWFAELEGDSVYLVFRLGSLAIVPEVRQVLRTMVTTQRSTNGRDASNTPASIEVGMLFDAPVQFICDWEESPRCFLIADSAAGTTLRVTLAGDDLVSLADALDQVVKELPASALETVVPA